MKEKIITLLIGVLVGAIITTAGFMIYNKITANNEPTTTRGQMNFNGEKPDGEMPQMQKGDSNSIAPEKPGSGKTQTNNNA